MIWTWVRKYDFDDDLDAWKGKLNGLLRNETKSCVFLYVHNSAISKEIRILCFEFPIKCSSCIEHILRNLN